MKVLEFFDSLEKVCPYQDTDEEAYIMNMEPIQPTCMMNKYVSCCVEFCIVVRAMVEFTKCYRSFTKGFTDPVTLDVFFNILKTACPVTVPFDSMDLENGILVCECNNNMRCCLEFCPVVESMEKYIVNMRQVIMKKALKGTQLVDTQTKKPKTVLQDMREKNIKNKEKDADGWIRVENDHHMAFIKSNREDNIEIKSVPEIKTEGPRKGLNEIVYYYRVLEMTETETCSKQLKETMRKLNSGEIK